MLRTLLSPARFLCGILDLRWISECRFVSTRRHNSPDRPIRLSSFVEEVSPAGGAALGGTAPPGNVLAGQGALGAVGGGAVVGNVLIGSGAAGSLQTGSAAPVYVDLYRGGMGGADAAGEATPTVVRHPAEGEPGDRLRARAARAVVLRLRQPRARVVVLSEAP